MLQVRHRAFSSLQSLSTAYAQRFPNSLAGPRRIGREAEYIVVKPDGSAGDVQALLARLQARNPSFEASYGLEVPPKVLAQFYDNNRSNNVKPRQDGEWITRLGGNPGGGVVDYSIEVGTGTVEVVGAPCSDLHQMAEMFEKAMVPLIQAANEENLLILGVGIQPITRASQSIMTPRRRYANRLSCVGPAWLGFTITASDQTHVDVDRHEMIPVVNLTNALTPAIIGFCANSSVYSNGSSLCGRDAEMGLMQTSHPFRYGIPAKPFASVQDWVETICGMDDWTTQCKGGVRRPFRERVSEGDTSLETFLVHDKSVFHASRSRAKTGTVELRMACQQPWEHHMVVAALNLGIVEAHERLAELIHSEIWRCPGRRSKKRQTHFDHLVDVWEELRRASLESGSVGLRSAEWKDFLLQVLRECEGALRRRGKGEEVYLQPLFTRENPGVKTAATFRNEGLQSFLNLVAVNRHFS